MSQVYVLTNISMPGLVKVGRAESARERAAQLSASTSVPTGFEVAYLLDVEDAPAVEAMAHALMEAVRVNPRREFFFIRVVKAAEALQLANLMEAWNDASLEARDDFLAKIMSGEYGS